jgi:hypothetical protein
MAKDRGKGVINITAHLGSWELLPVASALMGEPLYIVARPLDNRRLGPSGRYPPARAEPPLYPRWATDSRKQDRPSEGGSGG